MDRNDIEISRRQALGALGVIGAAAGGAGSATSAFFSDQEMFENNSLVTGKLDVRVGFEEHYSNWSADENDGLGGNVTMDPSNGTINETAVGLPTQAPIDGSPLIALENTSDAEQFLNNTAGDVDPSDEAKDRVPEGFKASTAEQLESPCGADLLTSDVARPMIQLEDVKPGDFGEVTLSFALCDNPGFVWVTGRLVNAAENGQTEAEADDPDEGEGVELLDAVQTAVWVDNGNNYQDEDESLLFTGTLRNALMSLDPGSSFGNVEQAQKGLLLPGDIPAEQGGGRGANCFAASETHSIVLAWWLPVDHGNEIQSDSVAFDLGLYAEQCRHNRTAPDVDGTVTLNIPDEQTIEPLASDAFFEEFSSVTISELTLPADGFVAIYQNDAGSLGELLAHTFVLDSGEYSDEEFPITSTIGTSDPQFFALSGITERRDVIAVAHTDDGDSFYESIPDNDFATDSPYTTGGEPVSDTGRVRIS